MTVRHHNGCFVMKNGRCGDCCVQNFTTRVDEPQWVLCARYVLSFAHRALATATNVPCALSASRCPNLEHNGHTTSIVSP